MTEDHRARQKTDTLAFETEPGWGLSDVFTDSDFSPESGYHPSFTVSRGAVTSLAAFGRGASNGVGAMTLIVCLASMGLYSLLHLLQG